MGSVETFKISRFMNLAEIWIYPIKSLGGISVENSDVLPSGLKMDRRFMLVDTDHNFMTQRQLPKMATLGTRLDNNHILVYEKASPTNQIRIPLHFDQAGNIIANIWNANVDSFLAPQMYNEWFSDYFQENISLVRMNPRAMRNRDLIVEPHNTDMSYADGYPYLFLSRASVDQLNSELEDKGEQAIDYRQFRANLIIDDCAAFQEDDLKTFKVGDSNFNMVKPCVRCSVITVNQDTGASSKQPLKHLSQTRNVGNKVIFGMNAALLSGSTVNVGDKIHVKS